MTIDRAALSELELIELEEALYTELLEKHVGQWWTITGGKLYHADEPETVEAELAADGVDRRTVLVTFLAKAPPYYFHR